MAVDDVTVRHGPCQQADPNVFRCTFEGGHNCSFSPVYDPGEVSIHWEIYRGNDTYIKTVDHTMKTKLGHFFGLDINKMSDKHSTYNYKFLSEYFRPSPQSCVTFSYYMNGLSKNETLSFYIANSTYSTSYPTTLWSASGDMGPFWYSHRKTVSSNVKWKIEFGAETHFSNYGLIAIDDVIVEVDKPCPPKGFCDFEVGALKIANNNREIYPYKLFIFKI